MLANTPRHVRDRTRPWLLAPIDLQTIKAAGVTFAISMLERVVEEQARGDPQKAFAFRASVEQIIGEDLSRLKPGSDEAASLKRVLIEKGAWSQYLEVGIGPDAEVFTKAPVLSAVGTRAWRWDTPALPRGTTRSRRSLSSSRVAGKSWGDARQRRQLARFRGPFGPASIESQRQHSIGGARTVHPAIRRDVQPGRCASGRGEPPGYRR